MAVLSSLGLAAGLQLNKTFGLPGSELNATRATFTVLMLLPCALFLPWPSEPWFYVGGIISGFASFVGMRITFRLSAQHNGRVASLYLPVKMFAAFIIWFAISEQARAHVHTNPLTTLGIIGCLVLAAAALALIRKNDVSWNSFLAVAPLGVMYAATDIISRMGLEGALWERIFLYVWLLNFTMVLLNAVALARSDKKERRRFIKLCRGKKLGQAALIMAFIYGSTWVVGIGSITLAPNPAYVGVFQMLVPVWLLVYNRLVGETDTASPYAGTALVASAIGLALLTL